MNTDSAMILVIGASGKAGQVFLQRFEDRVSRLKAHRIL
jgi:hypothetical protein